MTKRPRLFVTLEGYAVEGGFDGPGGPMTCYGPTIALGRHAGAGTTDNLWRNYEKVLDFVPGLGFEGVRLTVEWARVEPRQGHVDEEALLRYGRVIRHARSLGLEVTITLIDAVWPSWLGQEAWLLPWVVPHVIEHARRVVAAFSEDATGVIVFAQPEELVAKGFLHASAPPWRRGAQQEAGFASAQIEEITAALRSDAVVGLRLVQSSVVMSLSGAPEELIEARNSLDVDELYVRSLLRGSGPTCVREGLLVQRGDEWRVGVSGELLSALL
ncbi:MAG TPA: family 1 glycosylhydrolase [Acidimicrobiales bacterium]